MQEGIQKESGQREGGQPEAVKQTKNDLPGLLSGNRGYILFILVLVYTFNFIDRQIIGILAVPIKADLGLSDTQLGLMGG